MGLNKARLLAIVFFYWPSFLTQLPLAKLRSAAARSQRVLYYFALAF
jgi:hypothetical protein